MAAEYAADFCAMGSTLVDLFAVNLLRPLAVHPRLWPPYHADPIAISETDGTKRSASDVALTVSVLVFLPVSAVSPEAVTSEA